MCSPNMWRRKIFLPFFYVAWKSLLPKTVVKSHRRALCITDPYFALSLCLIFTINHPTEAYSKEPTNKLEYFKSFLAERPIIEQITYSYESQLTTNLIQKLYPSLRLRPGQEKNNPHDYVTGKWQPNQYIITMHGHEGTNSIVSFGYNNGVYWQISADIVTVCAKNDTTYVPVLQSSINSFLDVLNFGIPTLKEGTLSWDNLNFKAQSRQGDAMNGYLELNGDTPASLFCRVEQFDWSYKIVYDYGVQNRVLPSSFEIFLKKNGENNYDPITRINIQSLNTTTNALDSKTVAVYATEKYLKQPVWLLVTNGQTMATTPSGSFIKIVSVNSQQRHLAKKVLMAFFFLSSGAFLFLIWRLVNTTNKKSI